MRAQRLAIRVVASRRFELEARQPPLRCGTLRACCRPSKAGARPNAIRRETFENQVISERSPSASQAVAFSQPSPPRGGQGFLNEKEARRPETGAPNP